MAGKIEGLITLNLSYPYKSNNILSSSEVCVIGDLPWYISYHFHEISGKDQLAINLNCNNSSNLWSCDAQVEIRLLPREKKPGLIKTFKNTFNAKSRSSGIADFSSRVELKPMVTSAGEHETHKIEASIVLTNIRGVLNVPNIDFLGDISDDNLSNVTFIFDSEKSQKLHANKSYLSLHSPVFKSMFFSNFAEQNQEQIVLDDSFEEFHELLQVIYPTRKPIDEKNVEFLIRLADKYAITHVMYECERFLMESEKVGVIQKLIVSDDLSLAKLQDNCFRKLVQIEQITSLRETKGYEKLSESVKLELLEKVFQILKK
ncbi:unnamed protein product [Caenorhabditis angaria]|uniref:BTB domain-containing protein n=1 Tax=Caenorhabditis angaria TaxID=860376 RepID=A0A9P1IK80_9PELO|nr:unnamed protein product [Caenorhabditis angaria]